MDKKIDTYTYSGQTYPWCETFSVGIFKWIPRASGTGVKRSVIKFRVRGRKTDSKAVYAAAQRICEEMNRGIFPCKKSMKV